MAARDGGDSKYSNRFCQIKDFPLLEPHENQKYVREFYAYALKRYEDFGSKPSILYVTDFTSHPSLLSRPFELDEFMFHVGQVFEVSTFHRTLEHLRSTYSERTRNPHYTMSPVVYRDLLIVKIKARLKTYNGKLECYAESVTIPRIEEEPQAGQFFLRKLYDNMFSFLAMTLANNRALPCLIPKEFWPPHFEPNASDSELIHPIIVPPKPTRQSQPKRYISDSMPTTRRSNSAEIENGYSQVVHNEPVSQPTFAQGTNYTRHQLQPLKERADYSDSNVQSNNKPHTDSNSTDSLQFGSVIGEPKSQIKVENSPPLVGSTVPDTEHASDYEDDTDDSYIFKDNKNSNTNINININTSITSIRSSEVQVPATSTTTMSTSPSGGQYKFRFRDLNKLTGEGTDNKFYHTEGYLVGILPQDFSYAVAKSYEHNVITDKYDVGDPSARQFELIFSETPPSAAGQEIVLTPQNAMKITIPQRNAARFFKGDSIEQVYIGLTKLNDYFYKNFATISKKLYQLQIYKTNVTVNLSRCKETIWTVRDFNLETLFDGLDLPPVPH